MRRVLQKIASRLARSRLAARWIFGIRFERQPDAYHYFDSTTCFLLPLVRSHLSGDERVIDMGTGAAAVGAIYLRKNLDAPVIAVDVDPRIVELARRNVAFNEADVDVRESRFFDAVPEPFDVVVFNPPYVRTADGVARSLDEVNRSQWDGGEDGVGVIADFLDALGARTHPATAYVGVNGWHVAYESLAEAVARRPELELVATHRSGRAPTYACVIRRTGDFSSTKSPSTSASMPLE